VALTKSEIAVLRFGAGPVPRGLTDLAVTRIAEPAAVDEAVRGMRRAVVVGDDADLATVLSRLLRTGMLDVEVARVRGWRGVRRARTAPARRVPLIRDDTGTALVGAASWLPPAGSEVILGEAVVDDAVLFDGEVAGVRIEPTATLPGVRASVLSGRRRRWLPGRAVQLGTTGARLVRDGVPAPREVRRSTFYRHTTGWLRVG